MKDFSEITAIVLAAGKGTRMKSQLPKVLHKVDGKPILHYTLENLSKLNLGKTLTVIGYKANLVKKTIGNKSQCIIQQEQMGTGHAVSEALPYLPEKCTTVLIVNGDDSAFYKHQTLVDIINKHLQSSAKMTILTSIQEGVEVSGRVIRNKQGKMVTVKANSELTEEQLKHNHEVVCGFYLFERKWLQEELPKVEKSRSGEYNITALIYTALSTSKLQDIQLEDSNEWKSINTKNELKRARQLWRKLYAKHTGKS